MPCYMLFAFSNYVHIKTCLKKDYPWKRTFFIFLAQRLFPELKTIAELKSRAWDIIDAHSTLTKLCWKPQIIFLNCSESIASCPYSKGKIGWGVGSGKLCTASQGSLDPTEQLGWAQSKSRAFTFDLEDDILKRKAKRIWDNVHAFLSNMPYGIWGLRIKNHKTYLLN